MPYKLLLADDSVTIQRVIELTFANEDVQVLTAGDGEQAIARVQADLPDIVLADIGMPKRSGYDVAAFVKGHPELAHIPVLLLTGAFEPVDESRAQASGCDGVLVKPFEPQHVIARVRELLQGAKGSPTQAIADIPRPAERLTPHRSLELPRREPADTTVPAGAGRHTDEEFDFGVNPAEPTAQGPDAGLESLDDYFDRLDAAFANLSSAAPGAALEREMFHDDLPPAPIEELPTKNDERVPSDADEPPPHRIVEDAPAFEQDVERFEIERFEIPIETTEEAASADLPVTFANLPSTSLTLSETHAVGWPPTPPVAPIEPPEGSPTLTAGPPPVRDVGPHVEGDAGRAVADAFSALLAVEQGEPGAVPVRLTVHAAPQITDELIEQVTSRVIARLGYGALREVVADVVSAVAERLVREEIERIRNKAGS
jgi:CheY-like chemotaxis protein